jgi:crossover junction endodeoxyribonuclease RuvC
VETIMRVLGIDPALASPTGWAVIDATESPPTWIDAGQTKPHGTYDIPQMHALCEQIRVAITAASPDLICIESPFAMPGKESGGLAVAKSIGVIIAQAWEVDPTTPIHYVAPTEVKRGATGRGNASKGMVAHGVAAMLKLDIDPKTPTHITDAIAVSVVGVAAYREWRLKNAG